MRTKLVQKKKRNNLSMKTSDTLIILTKICAFWGQIFSVGKKTRRSTIGSQMLPDMSFTWHVHIERRQERRRHTGRTNAHRRSSHETRRYGPRREAHLRRRRERRRWYHRRCYPGVNRHSSIWRILPSEIGKNQLKCVS